MLLERNMDAKQTLINLHKAFPNFDLDTLFKILDCIVPYVYISNYTSPSTTVWNNTVPTLDPKIY